MKIIFSLGVVIFTLFVGIVIFLKLNRSFGGNPSKNEKEYYKTLENYVDGKFINKVPISNNFTISSKVKETRESKKELKPSAEISIHGFEWNKINSEKDNMTWLGHSAFLLSIDNKKILVDPMLGPIASPFSFVGVKRYKYSQNILHIIDEMPLIDVVLITHDHYDHLDYQSIKKLDSKVLHFIVPLGVGSHLIRWGVSEERITELNWWEEINHKGLNLALTPSRHFSGRAVFNTNSTLWGGWAILGRNTRLFISGDGGYGPHFKEIGDKYGPFNMTLMEGAQYDRRWENVHMIPEQSVQANLDLKGENMMLMHWGGFRLANHDWREPIERALKEANKTGINLITSEIGETVLFDSDLNKQVSSWWKSIYGNFTVVNMNNENLEVHE
jgi:L-ascorbate metabolism protein UlaG (beta-lactamase superfamily)